MKIEVIGSGCPNCKKFYETTKKIVEKMGIKGKVEYLSGEEGLERLVELGSISSPALAINGKVVMTGFTTDMKKIEDIILKATK